MSKFKIGDSVRFIKDCFNSYGKNSKGEVAKITSISGCGEFFRVNGETYGFSSDNFELVKPVEYEDQWHLNDGKVTIPDDADKLLKDGSVVAFRKVKQKPWKFGEIFYVDVRLWREASRPKHTGFYKNEYVVDAVFIRYSPYDSRSIRFMVAGFRESENQVQEDNKFIYRLT